MSNVTVIPPLSALSTSTESAFTKDFLDRELWQGEVLSNVSYYVFNPVTQDIDLTVFEYVVVMCQDCDLEQDYRKRQASQQSDLISIILYQAEDAATIRSKVPSSDIVRRVKENREERFHYMEAIPAEHDLQTTGLPALTIDFKKFFCIEPSELYRQLAAADGAFRRSRLQSPFKEHLQARVSSYSARIGLPRPHAF